MKHINKVILILILISTNAGWSIKSEACKVQIFNQAEELQKQVATFQPNTSFDAKSDGYVQLEFNLSRKLTEVELKEVQTLSKDNKDQLSIAINGKAVSVSLNGTLNTSSAWSKIFKTMNIDLYTFGENENQTKQPLKTLFDHYNL